MGKVIGTLLGYMISGIPGALLGFFLGSYFDAAYHAYQKTAQKPVEIETLMVRIIAMWLGHMAYQHPAAQASLSAFFQSWMRQQRWSDAHRQMGMELFLRTTQSSCDPRAVLQPLSYHHGASAPRVQTFLEVMMRASWVLGIPPLQSPWVRWIMQHFGLSERYVRRLIQVLHLEQGEEEGQGQEGAGTEHAYEKHTSDHSFEEPALGDPLQHAYALFHLSPQCSDAALKKAYRKAMSRYHPDKLASLGLSEERMRQANQHAQALTAAYALIVKQRAL